MAEKVVIDEAFIKRAKELVKSAKSGNDEEVKIIFDELAAMKETSLFQELGRLTRDVHDTFKAFRTDSRITELAGGDMADAKERLHYVINMTQQAADATMTHIETAMPLCENITADTSELLSGWERFTQRKMDAEEFRQLSKTLKVFLQTANNDSVTLMSKLNEVMMAQSYQDITGQIIYKVIKLVEDVEEDLINLIKLSSEHLGRDITSETVSEAEHAGAEKNKSKRSLDGPVVPGLVDEAETLSGQDEVDDLLSSLGF
ncbi:MAG: protein phosphatase CheZ [gamma proteobacterium symbiont of Bathyaustriella thionipta]|nr:protein phosphatase CheZ [gamma proteobacterium symbiont of Bathyaustriella thionipta]MCU7950336.1 protein phosphatase CheZ [gamma proteobacterium symbiont of Bathyaustriella thionipta]MCU7952957.1 protein phosphatase CheZ [gamma proteobacterium symbiont of Bathyaustriella thionipta]MCU7956866.1 protein phosphatase CheZ [gamma proteobacterium symbiont of Bathyaustriella thionipta]MCU7967219.1 protein phosphatase CheZ [gamma proteobacterium symbiont of Bathyaustriella thionipta]